MQTLRGLSAPLYGVRFVAKNGLWFWVWLPLAVNTLVAAGSAWLGLSLVNAWLPTQEALWLQILKWLAFAILTVLAFLVIHPILSGPFIDELTARVEAKVRGHAPSVGFFVGLGQAVWHGVLKMMLYATGALLTAFLSLTTGFGGALGLLLTGAFLAFYGFDYPLARRGLGFRGKWAYLVAHWRLTGGFAVSTGILLFVPLAFIFVPPFAAIGATLVFLEMEDAEAAARKSEGSLERQRPPASRGGGQGRSPGEGGASD